MKKEIEVNEKIRELKKFIEKNSCSAEELEVKFSRNPELYKGYLSLSGEWKGRFQEYMSGKKTLPLTYDPFFKKMFSADIHSDRLSDFISSILGEKVTVKCMLPNENRIVNEASLLIMDMLVELEDGSLVNIEIQKVPYTFPGERITCYLADTMTRQYARVKSEKGTYFTYKDLNKVITIVIYEKSPSVCKMEKVKGKYIHRGRMEFDTGLEMEMYQECYVIALDEFKKSRYYLYNKEELEVTWKDTQNVADIEKTHVEQQNAIDIESTDTEKIYVEQQNAEDIEQQNTRMDVNAWLSLFVTDRVEDIDRNILKYPWLEEIYKEMAEYLVKPEEVFIMYSEALRILDENTVKYMVDELQGENKELKGENTELKGENTELKGENKELKGKNTELQEENTELKSKTTELEEKIIDFREKQFESERKIVINMKNNGFSIEQIVKVTGKTEAEVEEIVQTEKF